MTIRSAYVRCTTTEGQFSSEYAVCVETRSGRTLSFFADRRLVRDQVTGASLLQVQVLDDGHSTHVLLPEESFEEGSVWADVDVVPAP